MWLGQYSNFLNSLCSAFAAETDQVNLGGCALEPRLKEDALSQRFNPRFAVIIHDLVAAQTNEIDVRGRVGLVMGMVGAKTEFDDSAKFL